MARAIFVYSYCLYVGLLLLPVLARGNLVSSATVAAGSTTTASAKASSDGSGNSVCSPRRTSSPPYSKPIIHSNNVHSCGTAAVLEPVQSTGPTFGVRTSSPPTALSVRGGEVIQVKMKQTALI